MNSLRVQILMTLFVMFGNTAFAVDAAKHDFFDYKECSQYERTDTITGAECKQKVRASGNILQSQGIYFCEMKSHKTYPKSDVSLTCYARKRVRETVVFIIRLEDGSYVQREGAFYYSPSGGWAPGKYKIRVTAERVVEID